MKARKERLAEDKRKLDQMIEQGDKLLKLRKAKHRRTARSIEEQQ